MILQNEKKKKLMKTCENVAKSQNFAWLDMRDFGWPHQDSLTLSQTTNFGQVQIETVCR